MAQLKFVPLAPVPLGPLPRKTGSRGEIVTLPGRDSTAPLSPTPWSLSPWLSRQRGILHENSSRWHCGHHPSWVCLASLPAISDKRVPRWSLSKGSLGGILQLIDPLNPVQAVVNGGPFYVARIRIGTRFAGHSQLISRLACAKWLRGGRQYSTELSSMRRA